VTPRDIRILAWSDAAHGSTYGQSGYLGGLRLSADQQTTSVFHLLDWSSSKQSRVSFSSIGSEILAAATAADRGYALASNFHYFPMHRIALLSSFKLMQKVSMTLLRRYMILKITAFVRPSPEFAMLSGRKRSEFSVGYQELKISQMH
jgi:hypothetical protein